MISIKCKLFIPLFGVTFIAKPSSFIHDSPMKTNPNRMRGKYHIEYRLIKIKEIYAISCDI